MPGETKVPLGTLYISIRSDEKPRGTLGANSKETNKPKLAVSNYSPRNPKES